MIKISPQKIWILKLMNKSNSVAYFDQCFVDAVNEYLDQRQLHISNSFELDIVILQEFESLYRVVQFLRSRDAVRPMPLTIKRLFYLKRQLNQSIAQRSSVYAASSSESGNFR